jgi:hypothetical protein
MKPLFCIITFMISLTLYGQRIEVFGGVNKSIFHDCNNEGAHYMSTYNQGSGYIVGIGIDSLIPVLLKMRFTLQLDKYGGELQASDGGLGGGFTTKAKIEKTLIALGASPVNLRILKRIDFNFGFEVSRLMNEKYMGTSSGWVLGQTNWSVDLQDRYDRFSALTYFGLRARVAFDLFAFKSLVVSPEYLFYYGISNEFDRFPEETKSIRHSICIGIKRK